MTVPPLSTAPPDIADMSVAARLIFSSRRSALVVALTVFTTTTIQVLAEPLAVLIEGQTAWTLAVPVAGMFSILILGCAAQACAFLVPARWPEATVLVVTAVYIVLAVGLSVPSWLIGMYLVMALALFALATRRSFAVSVAWLLVVVTSTVGALFVWTLSIGLALSVAVGFVTTEAIRIAAPALAGIALGATWATQTRRVNVARLQAEAAKLEHDDRVEHAAATERARIAQELHDVAGQHLAGLITLADAAMTIAPARPEEALRLVEEVRNEGRFAAASLAGALADLRAAGAAPRETTRDLRQANDLSDYWQKRGMRIRLATSGPIGELPAVVSTTAYRCAQEAITNAAKHAPGAEVNVEIAARPTRLDLAIINGPPPAAATTSSGFDLGWGLDGIRERVDLLRGTLVFGPTSEDGWIVRVSIPVAEPD